jgi:hypothetical protein
MVVIADELFTDISEVKANLDYYVQQGGNVVMTAINAKKLFPANSFSNFTTVNSGASFSYKSGTITEPNSFRICSATLLGAQTIATANGSPAVIEVAKGKGKYTIFLSDYGLSTATTAPNILQQVRWVIGDKMNDHLLFTVSNQLACTVNTLNDTTYLVGVYNNTVSQQALAIQSKIGAISSITEIPVGDDLTLENGYKPTSTTVTLGVNSATTIQALAVRLFKVIVSNPSIQKMEEVSYPTLPQSKFLAMDNFQAVRNTISGYPHFFDHFSGIKIDWKYLGDAENSAFKENVVWMNHQKLGIVLDFCETFPTVDFRPENVILYNSLVQKLANIKTNLALFSGQKIIVLPEPQNQLEYTAVTELKSTCTTMGADVLTKSTNGDVAVYNGTGKSIQSASLVYVEPTDTALNMKPLSDIYSQTRVVFNEKFSNWDSIYTCLDAINNATKAHIEQNKIATNDKNGVVKSANIYKYVSFHDIQSIKTEILKNQDDFFGYFGGVKVDGTYLWNQSNEACIEEGRWLKTHNVKVVVDLIRELNHYPNLTWTKELESYGRGKAIMDNILLKMGLLGCKDIIIGSHLRCELWSQTTYTNSTSITTGMKAFVDAATAKGITVHIQHREYQNYPQKLLASPSETMTLVNQFAGARFAANLGIISDATYLTGVAGSKLGLVILAYKGDVGLDCRNPLYKGMYNNQKPDYSAVSKLTKPMILDAEYGSWNEVILDCAQLGWTKTN